MEKRQEAPEFKKLEEPELPEFKKEWEEETFCNYFSDQNAMQNRRKWNWLFLLLQKLHTGSEIQFAERGAEILEGIFPKNLIQ